MLYSDGLVERRREPLRAGLERLRAAAGALVGVPTEEVCDRLVAALGVEEAREDDVAVLAVRLSALRAAGFHLVFPARPEQLRELRAAMRAWLAGLGVGQPTQSALLLAVGEACANAIEHGYRDRDAGEVRWTSPRIPTTPCTCSCATAAASPPRRRARSAAAGRTSCAR